MRSKNGRSTPPVGSKSSDRAPYATNEYPRRETLGYKRNKSYVAEGKPLRIPRDSNCSNGRRWWLSGLFGLAPALAWGASQPMLVTVINKHLSPAQPVSGVRVTLSYFDGSQKITDARDRTNHQGQTELTVSADAIERGELRVEVEDAPGLVIFQPGEGLLKAVPRNLEIALVPKGSPALLEPTQIEAMLDRLSHLSVRNEQLRVALTKAENQRPDFDVALRDWATTKGLPYEEVDRKVREWSEDVLSHRAAASMEKQAQAELGLRHYEQAAVLFKASADVSGLALDKGQDKYLATRRKELSDYVEKCNQSSKAFQFARQFHNATDIADAGASKSSAEHEHFPEDQTLRQIWLNAALTAEETRAQEGMIGITQESTHLLQTAADHVQILLSRMDQRAEPEIWARSEACLGRAFLFLAMRTSDRRAEEFRSRSVESFRDAIGTLSRASDSKQRARMQSGFGITLALQIASSIMAGFKPLASIDEAISAFKDALGVLTREEEPADWARTQMALAAVLNIKGLLESGKRSTELIESLVAADRAALEVFTRDQYPDDWSIAEEGLGNALENLALQTQGAESIPLYEESVKGLQAVHEMTSSNGNSGQWLDNCDSLSLVLWHYSQRVTGEQSLKLLAQSIEVLKSEFAVLNKADYAQRWARTNKSLGDTLEDAGTRTGNTKSIVLLTEAVANYRAALEVYKKSDDPHSWAITEIALGAVLSDLAVRSSPDQAKQFFSDSISAFQAGLSVLTKSLNTNEWALAQLRLAEALTRHSQTVKGDDTSADLDQALTAVNAGLEIYTNDHSALGWRTAQSTLGRAYFLQGMAAKPSLAHDLMAKAESAWVSAVAAGAIDVDVLAGLANIYHDFLIDFAKAYAGAKAAELINPTTDAQLNLAEASLTNSRFDECLDVLNSVPETALNAPFVPVRRTLLLACQAGARQPLAVQSALTLSGYSSGIVKTGWLTTGDRKYFAEAPEFATDKKLWVKLFQAVEDGDGPALAAAAKELTDVLGH